MPQKVIDTIRQTPKTLFSFELLPPLKGKDIDGLYATIDRLVEFKPPFINITYHREEVVYQPLKNGLMQKKTVRKRPGTVAIAAAIRYKYDIPVVPHMICGGFSREETENALLDLHFLGIDNVLALRGDPAKSERGFVPDPGGNRYAVELVRQIMDLNRGKYLDPELVNTHPTRFSVGVAGYPEKHIEAPNPEQDLAYLKEKVDAGADYIVTQLFFDNAKYFDFVRRCREAGIEVPIIPGLKPIATQGHLSLLPQVFNIDIPQELARAVMACKNSAEVMQVGVEWAIQQSRELVQFGAPVIHFYTMGKADNVRQIAQAVF